MLDQSDQSMPTTPPPLRPAELLSQIPPSAKVLLHVGCGTGLLGEEYKRRNPRALTFGIEGDPDNAEQARKRMDKVYCSNLTYDSTPFKYDLGDFCFDCLIYSDFSTLADDPPYMLKSHIEFLAGDGILLLHLRNTEHWSLTERLMRGIFSAEDEEVVVKSRRGLTQADLAQMFRATGLTRYEVQRCGSDELSAELFIAAMRPSLRALGIDPDTYQRRATPSHHIVRADRGVAPEQITIVSTMLDPVGGVSDVRVVEPMEGLRGDANCNPIVIANSDPPPQKVGGPKIMILHRPLLAGDAGLQRVRNLLADGWLVVCEFDDHPDYIRVLQRPDIHNFRAVHAIQTSTESLATVLRHYNPEVQVFENAIFRLPDVRNFASTDHITLFFAGLNRESEWPPYIEALNLVARQFGSRFRVQIVGDRGLFDAVRTEYKRFSPICDYDTYREMLADCEISFMPLTDTPFNRCKSDLKYIEAAAHRVVGLGSHIAYEDRIDDGRTGILFRTQEQLHRALSRLIEDPEFARSIADAGRQYVRDNRMLAYQVSQRAAWYRSLWQRRDILTRSLLGRIPTITV